jgi:hypothetical protein
MINAAHHSRELITIQMALYQALRLIYNGVVKLDSVGINLLEQNKYYIIPIVNADGVAMIE